MLFKKTFRRTTLLSVFFVALLVGLAVARLYAVVGSVAAVGILGAVTVMTYKKEILLRCARYFCLVCL